MATLENAGAADDNMTQIADMDFMRASLEANNANKPTKLNTIQ